jgi:nucleoid DNA-binding protein
MNKKEISEQIFKRLDVKRFEAYHFIDLLIETIVQQLSLGKKVVISNFGSFKVVSRQKKRVINPNDKKPMTIKARKIVKFIASKNLKQIIE